MVISKSNYIINSTNNTYLQISHFSYASNWNGQPNVDFYFFFLYNCYFRLVYLYVSR